MLSYLSALVIGLLAGAMLFIALALVPFWQQLPPAEFRAWFAAHSWRIGELMFSLGIAAVLLSLSALIRDGTNLSRWIAFGAALAVAIVTIAINEPANVRFAAPTGLSDPETMALLVHWKLWHWIRVAFGLVAFSAALSALRQTPVSSPRNGEGTGPLRSP